MRKKSYLYFYLSCFFAQKLSSANSKVSDLTENSLLVLFFIFAHSREMYNVTKSSASIKGFFLSNCFYCVFQTERNFIQLSLSSWWGLWWPARPPRPARRCPGPSASSGTSPSPPWSSLLWSATLQSSGLWHVITFCLFYQWMQNAIVICSQNVMNWTFLPTLHLLDIHRYDKLQTVHNSHSLMTISL